MKRKEFLQATSLLPFLYNSNKESLTFKRKFSNIRFGICADLHQDIIHDAPVRLKSFINEMNTEGVDFIIQLGDFCIPYEKNKIIVDIWKQFNGPKFHVIGNHDLDGNNTKEELIKFWDAMGIYYSFDIKGYHCIVLDSNDPNPSGFSNEQLLWLESDLKKTKLPTLVFAHYGLDNDRVTVNAMKVRYILERANEEAGFRMVQLVFSGHYHCDYYNCINDIHYIQINSMSYHYMGPRYPANSYDSSILSSHPKIREVAPYRDPLWALIEISEKGKMTMHGKVSQFVGPTPRERGKSRIDDIYPGVPFISNRNIKLGVDV